MHKIRASDCSDAGTVAVGSNARDIAFDSTYVWVVNNGDNTVSRVRPSDGAVLGTFAVGAAPIGIAVAPDGQQLWVGNTGTGTIGRFRASDGMLPETISVGSNPSGILIVGGYVWVATGSDTVVRFAVGSVPRWESSTPRDSKDLRRTLAMKRSGSAPAPC